MKRRYFLTSSTAVIAGPLSLATSSLQVQRANAASVEPRVAFLLVDMERTIASIDERIYGHFLEHPDAIAPVSRTLNYAREFTVELELYTVAVVEIRAA